MILCATKQQKYANFVEKRINTNQVSIWAKMKCQLKTWKSATKSVKHKVADHLVELRTTDPLLARKNFCHTQILPFFDHAVRKNCLTMIVFYL